MLREKNTVNKSEENEPEKLNKLLITDYASVKNKKQKRWQPDANHDSYTFEAFKGTRIQVFQDNNRDFKSRTLFVRGERCPVALFETFFERRPLLKHWPCDSYFLPIYMVFKGGLTRILIFPTYFSSLLPSSS